MIAIAGGKGGCGKTTTALGVGRALAVRGVAARIVDLDAGMPNLHRLAGVERLPDLAAVAGVDAAVDPAPTAPQRDAYGVEIVPAPNALDDLDLHAVLDGLADGDRVTLLDCPAGAGPAAADPLRAATAAIAVSTDRAESREDAAKTVRMARRLDASVLGAVVTRTAAVGDEIAQALGVRRVLGVPDQSSPLSDPAVQDRYSAVARWLLAPAGDSDAAERSGGGGERRAGSGPSAPPDRRSAARR